MYSIPFPFWLQINSVISSSLTQTLGMFVTFAVQMRKPIIQTLLCASHRIDSKSKAFLLIPMLQFVAFMLMEI